MLLPMPAARLLILALTAACGREEAAPAPPARPPNVLLVVIDTLRADHLSAYGYALPTSPRLDALAARGALFTDCTAQASWTLASMTSLMTGLPCFQTVYKVPEEMPVLAERFREAGYRTGASVANSVLSADAGFERGVERFEARQVMKAQWSAEDVNRHALRFLATADERPWFLWVHYLDPHFPYLPRDRSWERGLTEVFDEHDLATIRAGIAAAPEEQRAELEAAVADLAGEVDRYDAEILYTDAHVGGLLDALERRSLLADTIVLVASDHGETLYQRLQHPDRTAELQDWRARRGYGPELRDWVKREHYSWVYQELVRTPLVVAGPGIVPGQRIDAMVSNLDVQPTLLGLAGLPVPPGPGRDLSRALRGGGAVHDADWVTSSADTVFSAKLPDGTKLILPRDDEQQRHGFRPAVYDLDADPQERSPRPVEGDPAAEELLRRLQAARDADPFAPWQGLSADDETLERLREMGYVK